MRGVGSSAYTDTVKPSGTFGSMPSGRGTVRPNFGCAGAIAGSAVGPRLRRSGVLLCEQHAAGDGGGGSRDRNRRLHRFLHLKRRTQESYLDTPRSRDSALFSPGSGLDAGNGYPRSRHHSHASMGCGRSGVLGQCRSWRRPPQAGRASQWHRRCGMVQQGAGARLQPRIGPRRWRRFVVPPTPTLNQRRRIGCLPAPHGPPCC